MCNIKSESQCHHMLMKCGNCKENHSTMTQSCLKQKKIWKHHNIQKALTQLEAQSSDQQSSEKATSSHNSKQQDNVQISIFKTTRTEKHYQNFTMIIVNFSAEINHYNSERVKQNKAVQKKQQNISIQDTFMRDSLISRHTLESEVNWTLYE